MTRPSYGLIPDITVAPTEILASTEGLDKIGIMLDNAAAAVAATYTSALAGANNDFTLVAKNAGTVGNHVEVALIDPAGNNQALAVTVVDGVVTCALATGAGGAITTTATELVAAINASAAANKLVTATVKTGDTGAGVVVALAAANLTGGTEGDPYGVTTIVKGTVMAKVTGTGLYRPYNDGNDPAGVGTALGVLSDDFSIDHSDQNDVRLAANMWISGAFVEANLTGLDANAKTDLGGRSIGSVFKF